MVLLRNFINIFSITELRKKILFTLGILVIYRLGVHIPVIGIDVEALHQLMQQAKGIGGVFSYLDLFSGGMLRQCTLFALGIGPYITASIMMQMLGITIPSLEQLLKEGQYGRKIINQYTRYLALIVGVGQSIALLFALRYNNLVLDPGWGFNFMFVLSLTVGSLFVMWLGEQIDLFGLGNGSSLIIFAGIIARYPEDIGKTIYAVQAGNLEAISAVLILAVFVLISACIVFLEKGERKIPVQYTRRVVGQRVYGGQSSYIPFKINTAGVMPAIFASTVISVPIFAANMLSERFVALKWLADSINYGGIIYSVTEFLLIIFFSFFYTALVFDPEDLADNIKKSGGFIPGIRPGRKTADFFYYILTRIGLVGAIYLGFLALSPSILNVFITMPFILSGTALLIVVGVGLETASQIESYLIEHRYEGFLTRGRVRGRGGR